MSTATRKGAHWRPWELALLDPECPLNDQQVAMATNRDVKYVANKRRTYAASQPVAKAIAKPVQNEPVITYTAIPGSEKRIRYADGVPMDVVD